MHHSLPAGSAVEQNCPAALHHSGLPVPLHSRKSSATEAQNLKQQGFHDGLARFRLRARDKNLSPGFYIPACSEKSGIRLEVLACQGEYYQQVVTEIAA